MPHDESTPIARRERSLSLARRSILLPGREQPLEPRVSWIFFAFGASVLLPWNALITATPYALQRLEGSPLQNTFNSWFSVSFTLINFIALAHAGILATKENSSTSKHILQSTTVLIVLFILLTVSPILPLTGAPFFAFFIIVGMLQASAGAYLQSAVVRLASLFGPQALQSTFSGQAAVGVVVSVVQYVSTAASMGSGATKGLDQDKINLSLSAFLFFGISTAYLVFTLVAHAYLLRLPAYMAVVRPFEQAKGMIVEEEGVLDENEEGFENEAFLSGSIELQVPGNVRILQVAKTNILFNVAVCYVFVVTLCVYPPITSSILSVHATSSNPIFSPVLFITLHFLVFNMADWAGRMFCQFPSLLIWSSRKLAILSLSRTLFVPLFLACNVSRPGSQGMPLSTPFINSDLIYLAILTVFGISNGYLASMCMMAAASKDHNLSLKKEEVEVAATVAQFCLIGGLFVGSAFSFIVKWTICDCNPFYG